jgi:hypothetical protein
MFDFPHTPPVSCSSALSALLMYLVRKLRALRPDSFIDTLALPILFRSVTFQHLPLFSSLVTLISRSAPSCLAMMSSACPKSSVTSAKRLVNGRLLHHKFRDDFGPIRNCPRCDISSCSGTTTMGLTRPRRERKPN